MVKKWHEPVFDNPEDLMKAYADWRKQQPSFRPGFCFHCGKDITNSIHRGQVTIAGFFSERSPAFYNFDLCEDCALELDRIFRSYLLENK